MTFTLTILPAPVLAAEICRAQARPLVRLDTHYGTVRYIDNASRARLRQLYGHHGAGMRGWEPIGLTVAELGLNLSITVKARQMADGQYCSTLDSIDAAAGYHEIDVYIARGYPQGSCQYGVIVTHERRHVVIFQQTLKEYAPALRRLLQQKAYERPPIIDRDRHRAVERMRRDIQTAAKSLLAEVSATLDARNGKLDTGDAYRRDQAQCTSW